MLLTAETSALYGGIGVTGFAVIVLFSLGLAFVTVWLLAEDDGLEIELLTGALCVWMVGVGGILFVTTAIQRLVTGQ